MYANTVANNLIYSTIRIELPDLGIVGTGFFYEIDHDGEKHIFIITNNHVIPRGHGAYLVRAPFHKSMEGNLGPTGDVLILDSTLSESDVIRHPNQNVDLCCFPLSALHVKSLPVDFHPFVRAFDARLLPPENANFDAIEQVMMVGYPNGYYDTKNSIPFVRRGITATPLNVDFEGQPVFAIDIAAFPGSSGSPVVILDLNGYNEIDHSGNISFVLDAQRLILVGVLYSGLKMPEKGTITANENMSVMFDNWMHLGCVIKAREILQLEKGIKAKLCEQCLPVLAIPTGSF